MLKAKGYEGFAFTVNMASKCVLRLSDEILTFDLTFDKDKDIE